MKGPAAGVLGVVGDTRDGGGPARVAGPGTSRRVGWMAAPRVEALGDVDGVGSVAADGQERTLNHRRRS